MTILGYCGAVSYLPGQDVDLCMSTDGPAGQVDITVARRAGIETLTATVDVAPRAVPVANAWEGYGWGEDPLAPPVLVPIPGDWSSGYYEVRGPGGEQVGAFALREATPSGGIVVSIDVITYQAYDGTGGKSLYDPGRRAVSFDRPGGFPAGGRELPLLDWLADRGYVFACCASPDLERPRTLAGYDCLIIAGHAEYWSRAMYETVDGFVRGGGNLVCLSGNTCFRQVRLEDDGRTIVFYKFPAADPVGGPDATVGFADPPVNRPPNPLLGAGWTHGSFRTDPGTAQRYEFRFPNHWAMAGVTDAATQPFMSYETDAAAIVEELDGGVQYPRSTGEDESDEWTDIDHCYFAAALAVIESTLFVATTENKLWAMDIHGLRQP
jgi:N,N-dimethylformamidase beta subunit-like protein